MKQKPKQREVKKTRIVREFYVHCQKCGDEIKGTSESQVLYNLKLHLEKHDKEDKK